MALADRYLHTSGIDWNKEQAKCLSEAWLDDDEELGIQIVKDLHRTGSSLFSGPNGNLNQAKLKCILLGFARWNPQVGYCQVSGQLTIHFKFSFTMTCHILSRLGIQHAWSINFASDGQKRN